MFHDSLNVEGMGMNGEAKVQSIQIHPELQGGGTLVRLLRAVCKQLQNVSALTIHSSVHGVNLKSLSLHQRLGLDQVKREGGRVFFETSSDALIKHLSRFEPKVRSK